MQFPGRGGEASGGPAAPLYARTRHPKREKLLPLPFFFLPFVCVAQLLSPFSFISRDIRFRESCASAKPRGENAVDFACADLSRPFVRSIARLYGHAKGRSPESVSSSEIARKEDRAWSCACILTPLRMYALACTHEFA